MNLHRGLFRLWLLLSAAWIVVGAWLRNLICEFDLPYYGNGPWCSYQLYDLTFHAKTAALLVGPPVLAGLIGWVALGFMSESRNSN